jgi:glycine cleavage system transcriptional repressor
MKENYSSIRYEAVMNKYLVISALGEDCPGIVNKLSKVIVDNNCNIEESRMAVLGGEFALILMISGHETAITKTKELLPAVGDELKLTIITKETELKKAQQEMVPCKVTVVSIDHPGIVHEVAEFFSSRTINIEEMNTESYSAAYTGAPMFSINMAISVPAELHITRLREEFISFCDSLNMDATLSTEKL